MNAVTAFPNASLGKPIPPADSIPDAVRALNGLFSVLSSKETVADFKGGNSLARFDATLFAAAWEGARTFRDHMLLCLARTVRDDWRRDVVEITKSVPEFARATQVEKALEVRIGIALDFAFRFLPPRQICLLADALLLAFESDVPRDALVKELAAISTRSPYATPVAQDAMVLGGSGMFRYQPERLISTPARTASSKG